MGLASLCLILGALTDIKELIKVLNRCFQVSLLLINQTNLLIAFSLFISIVCTLWNIEATFKELQGLLEIFFLLISQSNNLVNTHKVWRDLFLQVVERSLYGFVKSFFQVIHCFENVAYFLFTEPKTLKCLSFSLDVLEINRHVQASLVEVWGRFIII